MIDPEEKPKDPEVEKDEHEYATEPEDLGFSGYEQGGDGYGFGEGE